MQLFWQAGFFPFIEKLYPPVCSTVPASLQAQGCRPRDCSNFLTERWSRNNQIVNSQLPENERSVRAFVSTCYVLPFIWGKWGYQKLFYSLDEREKVNRSDSKLFVIKFLPEIVKPDVQKAAICNFTTKLFPKKSLDIIFTGRFIFVISLSLFPAWLFFKTEAKFSEKSWLSLFLSHPH